MKGEATAIPRLSKSCLIAYYRWFKKIKGHLRVEDTSVSHNKLAFVTLEVSALSLGACFRANPQFFFIDSCHCIVPSNMHSLL